jgi:D-glycero-D-manno-heptose 1,7-bisphosphate phosphatase
VKRAVFLDRDGTLIEEVGYLDRLEQIAFFPFSVDAVRLLNRAGFAVLVVTNQSGVARGLFDEAFVERAHREMAATLARGGAAVDGFFYCPHHPEAVVSAYRSVCDCRKPRPGLVTTAATSHGIDLSRSFVVGDRAHDVESGMAVGAAGALVRTGYGAAHEAAARSRGAVVTNNLMEAVAWILRQP